MRIGIVKHLLTVAAAVLFLPFLAQTAHADNLDFTCSTGGPTACSGTVTLASGVYSTANLVFYLDNGPAAFLNQPFTLAFNTSTNMMSLTDGSTVLSGTITNFSTNPGATTTGFYFNTNWRTLPAGFQTFLGSTIGLDQGFVIYNTANGAATSSDIFITAAPEPGSAIMLGSGLLGLCGLFRRKASNDA